MNVPGSNLLAMAQSLIGSETITLYRYVARTQNARGDWVNQYAPGMPITGSWQPVEQAKYQALGLDLKKVYFYFYTQEDVKNVQRDGAADLAERNGRKYEADRLTPWKDVDGWNAVMFVDVGVV